MSRALTAAPHLFLETSNICMHTYVQCAANDLPKVQADEEKQRSSSRGHEGSSDSALVQLRAMQRRNDLHAVELVLGPEDRSCILPLLLGPCSP